MKIYINHEIKYEYTEKVFLEPHFIRLTPFSSPSCKLLDSCIEVTPKPENLYSLQELGGCSSYFATFCKNTDFLEIKHYSAVELNKKNPFEFIIHPSEFNKLPFPEGIHESPELRPFLIRNIWSDEVGMSAYEEIFRSTDNTLQFLTSLASDISKNIPYIDRENGNPFNPEKTMKQGGSCRDKTLLFIDICRSLNIPARYVTGYPVLLKNNFIDSGYHAWAEVFIPGAGWLGIDPTSGIMCYGFHIKLAASPYFENTMPAQGTYRGNADSKISYKVDFWK